MQYQYKNQEFAFGLVIHLLLRGQRPSESQLEACGQFKDVALQVLNSFDKASEGAKEKAVAKIANDWRSNEYGKKYADMYDAYVAQFVTVSENATATQPTENAADVVISLPVNEPSPAPAEALPVLVEEPFNTGGSTIDCVDVVTLDVGDLVSQDTSQEEQAGKTIISPTSDASLIVEPNPAPSLPHQLVDTQQPPTSFSGELPCHPENLDDIDLSGDGRVGEEISDVSVNVAKGIDYSYEVKETKQEDETTSFVSFVSPSVPWPDPKPLDDVDEIIPDKLDPMLLPTTLRTWAVDVSERMQVPLDFTATSLMVAAGSAIGRKVGIRPKKEDEWNVICNLWSVLVAEPGSMKTPAMQQALTGLQKLEDEAAKEHAEALREYEVYERWHKAQNASINEALKNAPLEEASSILEGSFRPRPVCRRYIANGVTPEKLEVLLSENPNGILLLYDELSGLFAEFKNVNKSGLRPLLLECWTGDNFRISDTLSRGTTRAPHLCLSLIGTIQPGVLWAMFRNGIAGGREDDGLLQRLQMAVWPKPSSEYVYIDRLPDRRAKQQAEQTIQYLAGLTPEHVNAMRVDDESVPFLRFEDSALDLFIEWLTGLEYRVRTEIANPALRSHFGKYRSLMPSLALIHHLAERRTGPVTADSARAAIGWTKYLESHAWRIYTAGQKPTDSVHELVNRLRVGDLKDGFTVRNVYRNNWICLETKEKAEVAVHILTEKGWLRAVKMKTQGRSTVQYHMHPQLVGGGA